MRRTPLALLLVLALGCVPSKNPFFLPEDALFVDALVGEWHSADADSERPTPKRLLFGKGAGKAFVLTDENDKQTTLQLFRLGEHYFADHLLEEDDGKKYHVVYKVSLVGERLEWWTLDPKWVAALLKKDPEALAHEGPGEEEVLLTAPSKDLRAFVGRHAEDPHAFGKLVRLIASKAPPVSAEGFGSKRHRTLDYWYELCMTCRSTFVPEGKARRDELLKELARITRDLENLPPDPGIDAEAVECGKQAAAAFGALARYVDGRPDVPQKLLDAFVRRATSTDRLGAARKVVEDDGLRRQIDATLAQFDKARDTLQQRHQVKLMGVR